MLRAFARQVAFGLAAAACLPVWCTTVTVGRASTEVPDQQPWTIQSVSAPSIGVTAGVDGRSEMAITALWLESSKGSIDALIVLEGSRNSYGSALIWGESCQDQTATSTQFVRNAWTNLRQEAHDDCLIVAGPVNLPGSLDNLDADVAALLARSGARLPDDGFVIRSRVARQGTTLTATLYLRSTFRGSANPLSVPLGPAELPAAVVQWGIELAAAVKSSTLSVSGRFKLPAIEFDAEPPPRLPVDPRVRSAQYQESHR